MRRDQRGPWSSQRLAAGPRAGYAEGAGSGDLATGLSLAARGALSPEEELVREPGAASAPEVVLPHLRLDDLLAELQDLCHHRPGRLARPGQDNGIGGQPGRQR